MRFEVLGEIRVVGNDGEAVELGGPRQRLLLAVLLASPDRTSSVDRLTDALWDGEEPPERPSRPIQTYVSRLRAAIGAERIVTGSGGYRLELADDDEVDAEVLEELVDGGRRQRAVGESARAAETLRIACEASTGHPYGELAARFWAVGSVRELADLRALAVEEHAACLLELDDRGEPWSRWGNCQSGQPRQTHAAAPRCGLHGSSRPARQRAPQRTGDRPGR